MLNFSQPPDTIIEQQIWKTQVDLQIFQGLMSECNDIVELIGKTRYIKLKQNLNTADIDDSEQCETEEATGGEAIGDEIVVEKFFLETTV